MLDFTKLWNSRYLFGPYPLALSRSDYIFFGIAAAGVVLGIITKVLALRREAGDPRRILWSRLFHLFLTTGLLLLLWAGARYENIPWIGAHFVALMFLLIGAVWLGFIVSYRVRIFPGQMRHWEEDNVKQKYLPR